MKSSKHLYLVISDSIDPMLGFGESIYRTTAVATNFRKAYDLAMSIGNITNPSLGYKAALNRTNNMYAVQLKDLAGSSNVTIALIKKY